MTKSEAGAKPSRRRLYTCARSILIGVASLYALAVICVMTPLIQTHVLYAHYIDVWGYKNFDHPESYGLAPGKTVNLRLKSADNTTIGAWFIFSDSFYRQLPYPPPPRPDIDPTSPQRKNISSALQNNPTILFFHGNTGTRALALRTAVYTALTARLNVNILAIDYRGYGDSEGYPTVQGLSMDARAGWDFLMSEGAEAEDVLVMGHSLGTAVAGLLAAELGREGVKHRGTVLMSPFSSVRTLIDQYYLFGCLPLLKPLSAIPFAPRLVTWSLVHRFDTLALIPDIKSSVLIAHADNDKDIPSSHASTLFNAFLSPYLPSYATIPPEKNPMSDNYTLHKTKRAYKRSDMVSTSLIEGYGVYEETNDEFIGMEGLERKVALLRIENGEHDIGKVEGVQDTVGRMFGFY
ncbi:alpha/beta-hydrolase [Phlegmacium glaucopus]|nr:alpha/beta-hydrolase [Phlegmacium glaucopus]